MVNSERHCDTLRNYLVPQLQETEGFNVETWSQLATPPTNRLQLLINFSRKKVIFRRGIIKLASADLTPLDYGDSLNRKCMQLKHNIRTQMAAVFREMCRRVAIISIFG